MNRRGAFVWIVAAVVVAAVFAAARQLDSNDDAASVDESSTRIVMFGDSLTEQGNWPAMFPEREIVGAGFSGYTSELLAQLAGEAVRSRPTAVFVLAGTNDIFQGQPASWTAEQLGELITNIETASPDTQIVLQTVPPSAGMSPSILSTNEAIRDLAAARGVPLLDLYPAFDDGAGGLRADETYDGVHFTASGYDRWAALLRPRFADLDPVPTS